MQELNDYSNLRNAISQLTAHKGKLESENGKLSFEKQTLKSELDSKSEKLRSIDDQHKFIEQKFDRMMDQKTLGYEDKIKEMTNAYVVAEAQSIRNIRALKAKEKQQMSLLNKINIPLELSPIVDATRGRQVDGESLKRATIMSMESLYSRLDDDHNSEAKSKIWHALRCLKEEFIVF
jgi:predicted nuclease with TOPRIM domain